MTMKYMLMMNATKKDWGAFATMSPADITAHIQFMKDLNKDLAASGELVDAQGLTPPDQTQIVRAGKSGGAPVVTDGPFPEAKEFLAGYWILDVRSPERVYEIAARISSAPGREGAPLYIPVELRQVGEAPKV
jgi:hypothetical protein